MEIVVKRYRLTRVAAKVKGKVHKRMGDQQCYLAGRWWHWPKDKRQSWRWQGQRCWDFLWDWCTGLGMSISEGEENTGQTTWRQIWRGQIEMQDNDSLSCLLHKARWNQKRRKKMYIVIYYINVFLFSFFLFYTVHKISIACVIIKVFSTNSIVYLLISKPIESIKSLWGLFCTSQWF